MKPLTPKRDPFRFSPGVFHAFIALLACLTFTPARAEERIAPGAEPSAVPSTLVTKGLTRTEDPVVLNGRDLPGMIARPIGGLRAYALREGRMIPIPFQVDEFDREGRILSTAGASPGRDDDEGRFDANDELVVMAFDLGDRARRQAYPEGARSAAETEVTDPETGKKAWFYVFDFDAPPAPSPVSYVAYDPEEDLVDTARYRMDFNAEHAVLIDDLRIKSASGVEGPNLIDRIKARTVLKTRLYLTFHFDEEDITTRVAAYKVGPIRVVRATEYYLRILFLKVTPSAYVDFLFYRNAIVGPSEMKIPFSPKIVFRGGSESISGLDFDHNIYGWKFYTEKHPDPVTLTGESMKNEGEKREGVRWLALYGKPGGTLVRVVYGQSLLDAKVGYIFFYRDDKDREEKPEREKGESFLGYYMDVLQFPKGTHRFWFYQYFAAPYGPGDEKKFIDILDRPLGVEARAVSVPIEVQAADHTDGSARQASVPDPVPPSPARPTP